MFINLMKKAVLKLRQCWQYFREHIDEILIRVVLLLVALAVAVMLSESVEICLQELLGLNEKGKYEVLKAIGFCIVGVLLVWQAGAANKRAKAMEDAAKEQANATKNTEAGQRQERLKNAIEHLGHQRDSVRMGGAYELFHLAEDTKKLRQTVLDILCAHVRQTTRGKDYQAEHKTEPSEEIQSLLRLLFVQEHDVFEDCSINLQGSYLNGAKLFKARLKRANLRDTQLQGANLWEAQLQGAFLMMAQMQGASLVAAQVQWADLRYAKLQIASLYQAQLQGAFLLEAQLQGADLWHAQLQGASLPGAQLQGANLLEAQLQGVGSREVYSLLSAGFESRIKNRIGMPSKLTGIIFAGGLKQEDLEALCEGLSDDLAQALREKLIPHVGKPADNKLPSDSLAAAGAYTREEAKQWIAEYNKAMRKAPSADDTANAASAPDSDKGKGD